MYLIGYYFKFDEIYIDMEDFYKKVLQKYNYRRRQLYLFIGLMILSFEVFFELLILNLKCYLNNTNIKFNICLYKNTKCTMYKTA